MFISHFPSLLPETTRMRCPTPSCRFKDVNTRHSTSFYSWIHADVISFLYTCTATTRNVHFHSSSSPPRFLLFLTPPRPLRRPTDSHITTWSARSSLSLTIHYIIINIHYSSSLHCLESNYISRITITHTHLRLPIWRTVFHNLGWLPWIYE